MLNTRSFDFRFDCINLHQGEFDALFNNYDESTAEFQTPHEGDVVVEVAAGVAIPPAAQDQLQVEQGVVLAELAAV